MTSEGEIFSQQELNVATKKMKENKAVVPESTGSRRSRETKRLDEWSRYPERVERQ